MTGWDSMPIMANPKMIYLVDWLGFDASVVRVFFAFTNPNQKSKMKHQNPNQLIPTGHLRWRRVGLVILLFAKIPNK